MPSPTHKIKKCWQQEGKENIPPYTEDATQEKYLSWKSRFSNSYHTRDVNGVSLGQSTRQTQDCSLMAVAVCKRKHEVGYQFKRLSYKENAIQRKVKYQCLTALISSYKYVGAVCTATYCAECIFSQEVVFIFNSICQNIERGGLISRKRKKTRAVHFNCSKWLASHKDYLRVV